MAFIEMRAVAKGFGSSVRRTEVLAGVNLSVDEGEFVAVVGYSGSGKSTLVNLLAGLIEPDQGSLRIDGKPVRGAGPDRGVVFQNYSLLPWLTVGENVALAVDAVFPEKPRAERQAIVEHYVGMVGLSAAIGKRPHELSGGMRQRVSVARALAMNPRILLLDEPLGALDALTRATLQDEIEQIWRQERKTIVLITNDVDEGLLLADRVVTLEPGPPATLGAEFKVTLPRPRDRTALNRDPAFKDLRNRILRHLIDVGRRRVEASLGRRAA